MDLVTPLIHSPRELQILKYVPLISNYKNNWSLNDNTPNESPELGENNRQIVLNRRQVREKWPNFTE